MNPEHQEKPLTTSIAKHPTTCRERQRIRDLARMLAMGIPQGYTVEECIQAVHTEARLVHGKYDRWVGWKENTDIETLFASRRAMHKHHSAYLDTIAEE
ncbi:MAG: hypothetical protein M1294_06110 [Firmicutes bacterium]|nr:hypothetical protein [Bacillota bacterium]MCL5015436.1 hypothetical protein [Bacillota bacterium]